MSENEPQLPEKIRKALKASPPLTPPESFYRAVLEKIDRQETPIPWYMGFPMKGLATACVLVLIVLVTRETHKTQPELFQQKADGVRPYSLAEKAPLPMSAPVDTLSAGAKRKSGIALADKNASVGVRGKDLPTLDRTDLSETKEVQSRLNRPIGGLVENPSPFDEEDEKLRDELKAEPAAKKQLRKALRYEVAQPPAVTESAPQAAAVGLGTRYIQQARDTVHGAAAQNSFTYDQKAFGKGAMLNASGQGEEWKGDHSGVTAFRTVAVTSLAQWEALWKEHTNYIVPPPVAPEIDFSRLMIVGVFAGTKPSSGFAVRILDANTLPGKVVVSYQEIQPTAGMARAAVLTQPYDLKVVPSSPLPVTFEKHP